jgi:hypothetical protein
MEPSEEARGVVHWVRINMTALALHLMSQVKTPRLSVRVGSTVCDVVASEHLAVAINGTLFSSNSSRWLPTSGDLANAVNPLVADHIISHVWLDTYLLWFDVLPSRSQKSSPPMPHFAIASSACVALSGRRWGVNWSGELQWPSICRAGFCTWLLAPMFLRI